MFKAVVQYMWVMIMINIIDEEKIIPTCGCNNCGGRCVIKAHVKNGEVVRVTSDTEGNPDFPDIRACVRGRAYRKSFLHPDRLKYPMKRIGQRGEGKFQRISWDEALNIVAKETKRIKEQYGPAARYVQISSGNAGSVRGDKSIKRLLALDGGYLNSYGDYSNYCTEYVTPYIYGNDLTGNSYECFADSKLIILWSFNPAETMHGSLTTYYLKQAKEKGVRIICVDPRYTDTAAAFADEWIAVKPSTDGAMLAAMAYVILTEGLADKDFLDKYCIGFDKAHMPTGYEDAETVEEYLLGTRDGIVKNPEWASTLCGVKADKIRSLAREYAQAKPAAMVQGYGVQRHANGESAVMLGALLPCMTGNVGISGGWAGGIGHWTRRQKAKFPMVENPVPDTISSFLWTDAIWRGTEMTPQGDNLQGTDKLKSNIKAIYNINGNTLINQHSDCNRTAEILKDTSKVEFILVADLFMTASAKFADILLPAASPWECENLVFPWSWGDYVLYANKVIEPLYECKPDYDWVLALADKMGLREQFSLGHNTIGEWCRDIYAELREKEPELPSFEEFKAKGYHKYKVKEKYIAYQKQIEDLEHNPFNTPSGKIELFSARLFDLQNPVEIPAIPKYVPAFEGPQDEKIKQYPLQCIGWHYKHRCHSMYDNNSWLEEIAPQEMWINPIDADIRGISSGTIVEIYNDRGKMQLPAKVTERIMPGVIAVPQGAWYTPNDKGIDVRGNINTITTQRPTALAKGNPQHSNLVEVKLA